MKRTFTATAVAILLSGCAGTASSSAQISLYEKQFAIAPPTTEWLEQEEKRLSDLAAASKSSKDSAELKYIEKLLSERRYNVFVGEIKMQNTHRSLSLSWGNTGQGGAALRMPAYIHTLDARKKQPEFIPSVTYNLNSPTTAQTFPVAAPSTANTGQGYSHYEMSRWERYCNHGLGMDQKDWAFVKKEGLNNVPTGLVGRCNPPKKIK